MARKDRRAAGRLLAIGGNEDPDEDRMRILPHLVEMAGGKGKARIVVCSAPSEFPRDRVKVYRELFRKIGVEEVLEAAIAERTEAEDSGLLEAVERATAVFFTGGDQLRLTSLIAGTPFFERVKERLSEDRLVVAGTSAGAAAMSGTMIVGGAAGGTVRMVDVDLAPGLGLWPDAVVDAHFNQRGRVHRILSVFARNPQLLGIGIDEDTALDMVPGDRFTVIGSGAVQVFDGRVTHSNAPGARVDDSLALTDSVIHVLPHGYGFDLKSRRPLLPGGEEIRR